MKREPVASTAAITAAVAALIALVTAFGVPLSEEQTAAVLGVVSVLAPLVVTIARRWVYPAAVVEAPLPIDGADSPEYVDPGDPIERPYDDDGL